jgi:glucokinase
MIAAVDIGGTKIAVGMVDGTGAVLSRAETPTGPDSTYATGLESIYAMLQTTAEKAGADITGIGIGCTGPVDPFTGELGDVDFLPAWRHKNPVSDLSAKFKVPVAMENDADAGALAEAAWGAGRGRSRLIYVTVGTGIGGGIILDGKLYRGVGGAHPEIGHQVIDPSGPSCSCGFRGCWEALAAGPAMSAWFMEQVSAHDRSHPRLTTKEICELAKEGDPLACRTLERHGKYLGLGLANLINMFAPDAIVLAGSVMKNADLFMTQVRATIAQGCRFVPHERTELMLASLGENANLIGAARVWRHRFALAS